MIHKYNYEGRKRRFIKKKTDIHLNKYKEYPLYTRNLVRRELIKRKVPKRILKIYGVVRKTKRRSYFGIRPIRL